MMHGTTNINVYYSPLNVSSNAVLIISRSNFNTVSGIVTLCKWPYGAVHRTATYRKWRYQNL